MGKTRDNERLETRILLVRFCSLQRNFPTSSQVSKHPSILFKMPSAPSKKVNAGPGYYDLIKEAVLALKERSGSSRHAIDKFVAAKKGASYSKSRLNIALKRGVESGKLVPVKGSFKLAAEEKKAAAKKPAAAKPAAKKAATPAKKAAPKAKKPAAKKIATKTKTAKKPAAKKATKSTKTAKKPAAKKAGKATKVTKKVLAKKPKSTKKKVVKKSAAKKTTKSAKK
ncbi:hypothetical protein V7S43_000169 [Phytophthora oleae]|uniref:H15 domain-containing protein n=1 Tax=Phytophthora oleae TaxID=2107226 RepID=A0ABD3G699_9STRA